ncbi:MAG: hypothetical protein AB8G18_12415 [Gammaproteobacteria bacterium]
MKLLFALPLLLVGTAVFAQSQPITVNTVAEKEERYTDEKGVERSRLVPVATVIPGDQVVYTITFANRGTQAADGIKIVDPVPDAMRYVADSAFGPGTTISFSADDGKTFSSADSVTVSDGGSQRAATTNEFTHIQWVFNSPLEPGAQAYAQFKAILQ